MVSLRCLLKVLSSIYVKTSKRLFSRSGSKSSDRKAIQAAKKQAISHPAGGIAIRPVKRRYGMEICSERLSTFDFFACFLRLNKNINKSNNSDGMYMVSSYCHNIQSFITLLTRVNQFLPFNFIIFVTTCLCKTDQQIR